MLSCCRLQVQITVMLLWVWESIMYCNVVSSMKVQITVVLLWESIMYCNVELAVLYKISAADYGNVIVGVCTMKSFTPLWDRGGRELHAIMYLGTQSSLVFVSILCVIHMYIHNSVSYIVYKMFPHLYTCIHNSISSVSYTCIHIVYTTVYLKYSCVHVSFTTIH